MALFMLYALLGLAALLVTAVLDKAIGKERGLFVWALALLALTAFVVRPTPPPERRPNPKPLALGTVREDPTKPATPVSEPFGHAPLAPIARNPFQEQLDTNPLPPERIPEPPAVALPFPLPPTVPGPAGEARRLLRGAVPTVKMGDGSKLPDVPADAFQAYQAKPEDVFDWIVVGGARSYVYLLAIDGVKEGKPDFENPVSGLKWNLALQAEGPPFPKAWRSLKVTFAAVGGEEEAKGKVNAVMKARQQRVSELNADAHEGWFLRRSVDNLFVEACRRAGSADPKQLQPEQLLLVAGEMGKVGETGKEDGAGWEKARLALELALDKSRQANRSQSDVLLALIEAYRALHDERAMLATLAQYVAQNQSGSAAASGARWLGDVFLSGLVLPEGALRLYDRAIELQPTSKDSLTGRGDALTWIGDHRQALEAYRRAQEVGARAEGASRTAEAALRMGALTDARAAADAALAGNSFDARALVAKGAVQYAAGEVDAALATFSQAAVLPGDGPAGASARRYRAEALYDLGLCHWRLGHGDAARAAFDACEAALRTGSERGRSLDEAVSPELGRALIQLAAGNVEEASTALDRAKEQAPQVAYVDQLAGWIALSQGDPTRARTRFENAATLEPSLTELDGWLSEVRLAQALASVRAGVPAVESAAGFDAAIRYAERASAREGARSTDYAVREALTRLRAEHLTERHRFENALKTAEDVLQRVREERRALAIKGYCEYRLGPYEPDDYNKCLRDFQAVVDQRTADDDPYRVYAIDCLARIKHWQSLEEKVLTFDTRLANDWQTSESYGVRVLTDQGMLRFADAAAGGATQDGGPGLAGTADPTVVARNEKLFDKASFELVEMVVQIPPKGRDGGQINNVIFGVALQPGGAGGKGGLKQQGLAILWNKSKVAVRVGGGMDPLYKDGEVRILKTKAGPEMEWPSDEKSGTVLLSIERTDHKAGTYVVRLNGEKVLEDKIPSLKETRGSFELWIGGWSSQAANWDARIDNIRIVRRRAP